MSRKLDVNGKEYEIIKLLGKGKGGYSYLVTDKTNKYVLKQIHHEPCAYYQFGNKIEAEINDYDRLKKTGIKIPAMIDVDRQTERILKEYIDFVVQDGEIYYIDFECNDYMDEWNFENWGIRYWSKTSELLEYMKEHS